MNIDDSKFSLEIWIYIGYIYINLIWILWILFYSLLNIHLNMNIHNIILIIIHHNMFMELFSWLFIIISYNYYFDNESSFKLFQCSLNNQSIFFLFISMNKFHDIWWFIIIIISIHWHEYGIFRFLWMNIQINQISNNSVNKYL